MEEELGEEEKDIWLRVFSFAPSFKQYGDYFNDTNYFNDEPRFDSVFSRNKLARIKDGVYVINFNDKNSKGTLWV